MQKTDNNYFTHQAGEIHSPDAWNHTQLKKPQFLFRDSNRRYAFIQEMRAVVANYNTALCNLQYPIESNNNALRQLDLLLGSVKQIAAIQQAYTYEPAGNWINRLNRATYDWFYPKTVTTVKQSLPLITLVSTQLEYQQQAIEKAIYHQQTHLLLNTLGFQQTPAPVQTSTAHTRYNQLLRKHGHANKNKPAWAVSVYQECCADTQRLLRWLGTSSLQQKCDAWITHQSEDATEDRQQLSTVAQHLASHCGQSNPLFNQAKQVLVDWGQWAKQKLGQLDALSQKAEDLRFIFLPTQATPAQYITDAYTIIDKAITTAKNQKQQHIEHRLDQAESLAEQSIAKSQALIHQFHC